MYISKESLPPDLQQLMSGLQRAAQQRSGDCLGLLQLLRLLEDVHRTILEREFYNALPDTRGSLHALLQDIEEAGDWPYIPRMHIRMLLQKLEVEAGGDISTLQQHLFSSLEEIMDPEDYRQLDR